MKNISYDTQSPKPVDVSSTKQLEPGARERSGAQSGTNNIVRHKTKMPKLGALGAKGHS